MKIFRIAMLLFISLGALQPVRAVASMSAAEIVEQAENLLWGKTMSGDVDMTITTPTWSRTLSLHLWMDRPTKSFIRITAPAKDAGISSLRIASEMWNYLPAIERTIKVPPSLMLQPWLGSDFTNDDLVKESSIVNDYTHRMLASVTVDGSEAYQIEGLPKPDAAIVWGKVVYTIRKNDSMPLKLEFYNERGQTVRTLVYSDFRNLDGRAIPTRWEMQPAASPGKKTVIAIKSATYEKSIGADIFSLRNLKQKDK